MGAFYTDFLSISRPPQFLFSCTTQPAFLIARSLSITGRPVLSPAPFGRPQSARLVSRPFKPGALVNSRLTPRVAGGLRVEGVTVHLISIAFVPRVCALSANVRQMVSLGQSLERTIGCCCRHRHRQARPLDMLIAQPNPS